jgi:hypothetical protein
VVCLSVSDRELAEVRLALREEGEEVTDDYIPESHRLLVPQEDEPDPPVDGEGPEEDLDDGEEEIEGPSEVETPAGIVPSKVVHKALDEPFHADLVAADPAALSDQIFVSDTDMMYSRKLAAFGDVELPPPAFVEAVRLADRSDVPVESIDLTDDEYTLVFVDHVSYWQLVRHSRKVRNMRRRLRASNPRDLMEQWDRRLRELKGFAVLEGEREKKMAASLVGLLERHRTILAIIDHPRIDGTLKELASRVRA